ncbi:hypothetical protein OG352_06265 [Streptomyces sp. NBC_01485]|uniref:hypothetical protein n=1 Tax=Streptomyces sp. NBC_01485 TaxID=2903884 RepID=UPI002E327549|nr:hypothetical protein [Streptomyces sp. NBC_01485]
MLYEYRCPRCCASSPPDTRRAAEAYRQRHRDDEHGGLVPHGERIVRVPGSTRDSDGRYVSTAGLLGLLGLLAVAEFLARALGR